MAETILIVDDEVVIRRLIRQTLTGAGYKCLEAGEAQTALELLNNNAVEIVLSDIKMPGRSGVELLTDVTRLFPDTATIMLTAILENDVCIDCMQQGAYDYVTKPFNPKELIERVKQALEKRKLRVDNKEYQQHLEEKVEEQSIHIRAAFFNAITALAQALEAKDRYTSGHSQRVAGFSETLARQLGMAEDMINKIRLSALVHDIGKIGVSEPVLNKSEQLTDAEHEHISHHCEIGENILKPITQDDEILSVVRHHHERYDGSGYPDGIKGGTGQTALLWGIVALADAYDAMTSDRPYRKALSRSQALEEIAAQAGSQFDPALSKVFLKTIEDVQN